MEMGTKDGIFGVVYAKLTVNLACRGDNTNTICIKHLLWGDDSLGIPFAHEKANQTGNDPTKKLPRRCFCNPLEGHWSTDLASSLFHYLALHPEAIAMPNYPLLQGAPDAQATAFNRVLKKVLRTNVDSDTNIPLCEKKHSTPVNDISMYSYRKCSHTKLNCGSTAGPTSAAACLREGHSLGGARNPYIAQEQASDEYCGRILCGLPINSPEFAVSYPDFIPIPLDATVIPPKSDPTYKENNKQLDSKVEEVLNAIFTSEHMSAYPLIHRFLRIGLASHLIHFKEIDELLPANSILRQTPLFTSPQVAELRQYVRIAMPWEDHHIYFADPSGLPPHATQLHELREIKHLIQDWLPRYLEGMLEKRQMNGPVSLAQMRTMVAASVAQSPVICNLEQNMANLTSHIMRTAQSTSGNESSDVGSHYQLFQHADGKSRRVPPGWTIPGLSLQHMYVYWHCGNEASKISPIKRLDKTDTSPLGKNGKKTIQSLTRLMAVIDDAATAEGIPPKESPMTQAEANACFIIGKGALNIPKTTATGRPRNIDKLTWQSALKFMPKK